MRVINSKISRFIFYVSILFCIGLVFECFVFANELPKEQIVVDTANATLSDEEEEVLNLINIERKKERIN